LVDKIKIGSIFCLTFINIYLLYNSSSGFSSEYFSSRRNFSRRCGNPTRAARDFEVRISRGWGEHRV
jgi:hypothetical protein